MARLFSFNAHETMKHIIRSKEEKKIYLFIQFIEQVFGDITLTKQLLGNMLLNM